MSDVPPAGYAPPLHRAVYSNAVRVPSERAPAFSVRLEGGAIPDAQERLFAGQEQLDWSCG